MLVSPVLRVIGLVLRLTSTDEIFLGEREICSRNALLADRFIIDDGERELSSVSMIVSF